MGSEPEESPGGPMGPGLLAMGAVPLAAGGVLGGAPSMEGTEGTLGAEATGGEPLGGEEPESDEPHPNNEQAETPANSHATRFITSLSRTKRERPTV